MEPVAKHDSCIALLRSAIPEFEYQKLLRDEDGEVGPFEVMSQFAEWALAALLRGDAVAERAFAVVEQLATSDSAELALAGDLTAEFVEALWAHPRAVMAMGPSTRSRLRR